MNVKAFRLDLNFLCRVLRFACPGGAGQTVTILRPLHRSERIFWSVQPLLEEGVARNMWAVIQGPHIRAIFPTKEEALHQALTIDEFVPAVCVQIGHENILYRVANPESDLCRVSLRCIFNLMEDTET